MRKITTLFLVFSMFCAVLTSCADETPSETEQPVGFNIGGYNIIRSDDVDSDFISTVSTFKKLLAQYTEAELGVSIDVEIEPSEKEIIIGKTSRTESKEALAVLENETDDGAYVIKETNGKIVIVGKNDDATFRAMKYFLMTYAKTSVEKGTLNLKSGHSEIGNANLDSEFFGDTFAEFIVETKSDVAVPANINGSAFYAYETLIELQHQPNDKNNGVLIASHAGYRVNYTGYKIYKSTDKGDTWEQISVANDTINGNNGTAVLQPCLFELPADVGSFKKGTLILGACTNTTYRGDEGTDLVLYYSVDCGVTWKAYGSVVKGGCDNDDNGVWEPFFMYEEESGKVYCFYSDETDDLGPKIRQKNQRLVYKTTTDMINWSEPQLILNMDDRPGMISIAKMGNGKYFMTYEMAQRDGSRIYYRIGNSLSDWGNTSYAGERVTSTDGKTVGSGPWCAWTPAGGECGTLFVAARMMVDGESSTGTDLFVSFDYGETFITIDNFVPYKIISTKKCGYSPYIGFSPDGSTMYYMTNPDVSDTSSKVVFVRIKIW